MWWLLITSVQCICFNRLKAKIDKVKTAKEEAKIILRVTAKYHAHFQTLTKTTAKFHRDPAKTVGVAFRSYPVKINLRISAKRHAHFQTFTKTSAKFQKDPVKKSLTIDNESDSPIFYKSCFTGGQSVPLFHGLA